MQIAHTSAANAMAQKQAIRAWGKQQRGHNRWREMVKKLTFLALKTGVATCCGVAMILLFLKDC